MPSTSMTRTLSPSSRSVLLSPTPHSGMSIEEFYSMHFLGAVFPLTAGLLLFGWRALIVVALVCGSTAIGVQIWRTVGKRGRQLHIAHAMWLALLLSFMLPAHLASGPNRHSSDINWMALPAAGLTLVMVMWVTGGLGAGRIHPVIVTYLLMLAMFGELLTPHYVLRRDRLFVGDVLHGSGSDQRTAPKEPWVDRPHIGDRDSEQSDPPSERLIRYTTGRESPPRGWLGLSGLLRDSMPPLEDLIVGGQPGPIGVSSALAVITGGLFLLYRGLIDFRIPLMLFLSEYLVMLLLPVPTAIARHAQWHWLVLRRPDIGWPTAVTFVNYEIMAGPSLFVAFFIATSPLLRPMARRARIIYACVLGALCAVAQLYMSVSFGPYIALLVASLLTPLMDWWFRARPLL